MLSQLLADALDQVLPDERLFADLRSYLAAYQQGDDFVIVFDYTMEKRGTESKVVVPIGTAFYSVFKRLEHDIIGLPFRAYRARVAVGAVFYRETSIRHVEYCFADLSYSADMCLLTVTLQECEMMAGDFIVKIGLSA